MKLNFKIALLKDYYEQLPILSQILKTISPSIKLTFIITTLVPIFSPLHYKYS